MNKQILSAKPMLLGIIISIITCGSINNNVYAQNTLDEEELTKMNSSTLTSMNDNKTGYQYKDPKVFTHGIVLNLDGVGYYFEGPADATDGAKDAPGHYWWQDSPNHLYGLHFNIGPFGEENWWSSDAGGKDLLFLVDAIIAPWTNTTAYDFAKKGYTHYHELLRVDNGEKHPNLVVWFKHVGIPSVFNFDKGPVPEDGHIVTPGVDHQFLTNYYIPYNPKPQEGLY
ncbi:MAG: hypothetical protein MRJ93_11805 [Nitrososphaeraceae archaeon]|nr:hypothetical protein [Nitrososphaeraceae archaeon]